MASVGGTSPSGAEAFIATLTKLTCLRITNHSVSIKLPPMKCLTALQSLQASPSSQITF